MAAKMMEGFMKSAREEFRSILKKSNTFNVYTMKTWLKKQMDECCSQFEEDTLIENLAEEYKLYLRSLANGQGE